MNLNNNKNNKINYRKLFDFKVDSDNHSKYWLSYRPNSLSDIESLAERKKVIQNFVKILTGKHIPVEYCGSQSYTDGKSITISAKDPQGSDIHNYDLIVGLALHEGSHILLSDLPKYFKLVKEAKSGFDRRAIDRILGSDLTSMITPELHNHQVSIYSTYVDLIVDMTNIIEDRRVDNYIYSTAPGYQNYYNTIYKTYFLSKNITFQLKNSKVAASENINSYLFRICNLHNPESNLDILKGLKEIYKIYDLDNISRLKSIFDSLKIAQQFACIIFKNVDNNKFPKLHEIFNPSSKKNNSNKSDDLSDNSNNSNESDSNSDDNKNNQDNSSSSNSESKNNVSKEKDPDDKKETAPLSEAEKHKISEDFKKQLDFIRDKFNKTPIDSASNKLIEELTSGDVEFVDIDLPSGTSYGHGKSKLKTILIKQLNEKIIFNHHEIGRIHNNNTALMNAITDGFRLGKVLGRKLKIRNEERITDVIRKSTGFIDKRLLHEVSFNNEKIFSTKTTENYPMTFIHLTIDSSGSMDSSNKFENAVQMATMIAKACSMIKGVRIQISVRTSINDNVAVAIVYDSKYNDMRHIKKYFPMLTTFGSTPEGYAFKTLQKYIFSSAKNKISFFVNLSDGAPDDGKIGALYTKKVVDEMKKYGFKILSYFIGSSKTDFYFKTFVSMYSEKDSHLILANDVIGIAKTLNNKLLEK